MKERVQKLMAQANIGSRRACEELIRKGRVRVNGQVIGLGDKADSGRDVIEVDDVKLSFAHTEKVYIAYHKPINVLSTNIPNIQDERATVREMIPVEGHLFTIGRLDAESEGLIILTNDGEMANRLSHPRYEHTKTYKVVVYGELTPQAIEQWQNGVFLEEGKTAPCYVRVTHRERNTTSLQLVMIEGKKRQIRRVASKLGYPVKQLLRTQVGQLALGALPKGEWYYLKPEQVKAMTTPAPELEAIRRRRKTLKPKGWSRAARTTASDSERQPSRSAQLTRKDEDRSERDRKKRRLV